MSILTEKDKKIVSELLKKNMKGEVTVLFFKGKDCDYCEETQEILMELSGLSAEMLKVEVRDINADVAAAKQFDIDKVPAIVLPTMDGGRRVRYYGIPSGYEFRSLIDDISDISQRRTSLSEETMNELKKIDRPVHLQVFVTPTCPYCPSAVRTAHQLAMLNENIVADMIEATEFPELSEKYQVMAVPKVVINGKHSFEGALPENMFLENIQETLSS